MSIVVVDKKLTKEDFDKAREEYRGYIKITVDLSQGIVLIGGEYHADSEIILLDEYGSKQSNIWGGGYNINTGKFEVNALVNLRPSVNDSMDILDPDIRTRFLKLAQEKLPDIELLL